MIPIRPVIDCSPTSNPAMAALLEAGGPRAVVDRYAVPTLGMGYGVPIVRMIPAIDWDLFTGWCKAFRDTGMKWSLYFNPRGINASDVALLLIESGVRCIVEGTGMGEDGWVLGALKSVDLIDATEPAIDRTSPVYAKSLPSVITDYEWRLNFIPNAMQRAAWASAYQVPPWEGAGCWRWHQPKGDPHATRETVLIGLRAWYAALDPAWVRCAVIPADLATDFGITAAEITGA